MILHSGAKGRMISMIVDDQNAIADAVVEPRINRGAGGKLSSKLNSSLLSIMLQVLSVRTSTAAPPI